MLEQHGLVWLSCVTDWSPAVRRDTGKTPYGVRGRDGSCAALSQGGLELPAADEAEAHPPLEALEGAWPCQHLTFEFVASYWLTETVFFLSHIVWGNSLWQPWEDHFLIGLFSVCHECVGVKMDKTLLAKAEMIVLISSNYFNSSLVYGENPYFLWRISLLPCTYVFFS